MALVQVVCNVLIQPVNAPVMLDIKAPDVMLLVAVMPLVQVVQHVMLHLANVPATLDTLELHVILVPPTIIEQVVELVQVRIIS